MRPSMVGAIVRASLVHRVPVIAGTVLLMLLGLFAARRLDIDVLPDVSRPALVVMTEAGGLASEEVEALVTVPLERALAGLPATLRLRSSSAVGLSIVTVELDWGADVVAARQQAAERLAAARDSLPAGVTAQIQPISSIMGEIMLIGLTAQPEAAPDAKVDAMALRGIADWIVRPRLAAIAGVSQVTVIGGEIRQIRIAPDPALMAGLDVSVTDIERALARVGANAGGGAVDQGGAEFVIRALAPGVEIAGLANTVIATRKNAPILLRQVARVDVAAKPARGRAGLDGGDAVILSVQKQPGADTLALTEAVTAVLGELQGAMPAGVKADRVIFRQADFITVAPHRDLARRDPDLAAERARRVSPDGHRRQHDDARRFRDRDRRAGRRRGRRCRERVSPAAGECRAGFAAARARRRMGSFRRGALGRRHRDADHRHNARAALRPLGGRRPAAAPARDRLCGGDRGEPRDRRDGDAGAVPVGRGARTGGPRGAARARLQGLARSRVAVGAR